MPQAHDSTSNCAPGFANLLWSGVVGTRSDSGPFMQRYPLVSGRALAKAFAVAALLASSSVPAADAFPSRMVRLISPYAAGGGSDVQLRQLAPKLADVLRQQVVVENKLGATGAVAAQYVAQSQPDGHTLLFGSTIQLIQKHLQPALQFDPVGDFAPLSNVVTTPAVLVVRADSPLRRVRDLIAAARSRPGQLNYGSGGIGSSAHLAAATLLALEKLRVEHIPLNGSVEVTPALLRGDVDFAFTVTSAGVPQVRRGVLRALGVTSAARMRELPEVPTLAEELGSELMTQESWFGLWAPAKTPAEVQRTLHAAVVRALADPTLVRQLESGGSFVSPSESPEAYAAFVRRENGKWGAIVKFSAARAD